ncbi:hypothetical protein GGF32_005850 [Allomyces javanicus]|nr:hypothetical protein GGF32_005850 [Allomyces javanicus]
MASTHRDPTAAASGAHEILPSTHELVPGANLTLLHITDVHEAVDAVARVRTLLTTRVTHIDAVLVTGDLLNLFHPLDDEPNQPYIPTDAKVEAAWTRVLHDAIATGLAGATVPVMWVPGNHDPTESWDQKAWLDSKGPTNLHGVHGKPVRLAPGLVAVGLGGSVPADDTTGKPIWPGCPHRTDADFAAALAHDVTPHILAAANAGDQVVLLTHSGPAESATTVIDPDPTTDPDPYFRAHPPSAPILSGSVALRTALRTQFGVPSLPLPANSPSDAAPAVPLLVHGHSHWARGVHRMKGTTIVNPGDTGSGRAAVVSMRWAPECRWEVVGVELLRV